MRSGASLFGHFIRPMLVPFPLGLFVASFIFDVIYRSRAAVHFRSRPFCDGVYSKIDSQAA
jgi:uncharacterized membrane protein